MTVISAAGKSLYKLEVDDATCRRCSKCAAAQVCRGSAFITLDPGDNPFVDMSRCWGCLLCIPACPHDAVIRSDYG